MTVCSAANFHPGFASRGFHICDPLPTEQRKREKGPKVDLDWKAEKH